MPQPRIFFGNNGGGGGGGTVAILENGVPIVGACSIINFIGAVTVVNAGGGQADVTITGGGGGYNTVVYHVLTAPEIAAKQLTLPSTPLNPLLMLVDVAGGAPAAQSGVDYTLAVNVVSWNALGFDGVLNVGDVIRFVYDV